MLRAGGYRNFGTSREVVVRHCEANSSFFDVVKFGPLKICQKKRAHEGYVKIRCFDCTRINFYFHFLFREFLVRICESHRGPGLLAACSGKLKLVRRIMYISVLRIRDVYPGSRTRFFFHPRSEFFRSRI